MEKSDRFNNEKGTILVIAMFFLLLLTVMGSASLTSSNLEKGITSNFRQYKKSLYTAEAGLEHVKERLQTEFKTYNQAKIAAGQIPDWDFALKGIVPGVSPATDIDFPGGAVWIFDRTLDDGTGFSCHYTVTIWNNPEDNGGITDDTDQLIIIRSVASGAKGTQSAIEAVLQGQTIGQAITGYFAQSAGGQGNNRVDLRAVSDFTVQ